MTTKERALALLESKQGEYVSGEDLAEALGVSRTSVWKAIQALIADGVPIAATKNRGYKLEASADVLSEAGIKTALKTLCEESNDSLPFESKDPLPFDLVFDIRDTVTSTMDLGRDAIECDCAEGLVILAREQTKGGGRRGRAFDSPRDAGVYATLVLRPTNATIDQATTITSIAAVAACEAIEKVSGKTASIKWVNDVFVDGKKVVGILTEGSISMELGRLEYALLGIGFDLYIPATVPSAEYAAVAGNILDKPTPNGRNQLVAAFLQSFLKYYAALDSGTADTLPHVQAYKDRCFVIGRDVWLEQGSSRQAATVLDVDDACRLIVQLENGERATFASGEVSVRSE